MTDAPRLCTTDRRPPRLELAGLRVFISSRADSHPAAFPIFDQTGGVCAILDGAANYRPL